MYGRMRSIMILSLVVGLVPTTQAWGALKRSSSVPDLKKYQASKTLSDKDGGSDISGVDTSLGDVESFASVRPSVETSPFSSSLKPVSPVSVKSVESIREQRQPRVPRPLANDASTKERERVAALERWEKLSAADKKAKQEAAYAKVLDLEKDLLKKKEQKIVNKIKKSKTLKEALDGMREENKWRVDDKVKKLVQKKLAKAVQEQMRDINLNRLTEDEKVAVRERINEAVQKELEDYFKTVGYWQKGAFASDLLDAVGDAFANKSLDPTKWGRLFLWLDSETGHRVGIGLGILAGIFGIFAALVRAGILPSGPFGSDSDDDKKAQLTKEDQQFRQEVLETLAIIKGKTTSEGVAAPLMQEQNQIEVLLEYLVVARSVKKGV